MWYPWFKKLRQDSHDTQEILEGEIRAIHDATEAAKKTQGEMGVVIASAIERAATSVPEYEKAQRYKEYKLQRRMFWATVVGTIFAAAAAGGAWYYAHLAKGQLDQMIEATKQAKRSADTAVRALKENQRQFDVTSNSNQEQFEKTLGQMRAQSKALRESSNSEIATNRAWIIPDFPPQHKRTIEEVNLDWHNAGKTPAISVFSWKEYFTGEFPHQLRTCAMVVNAIKKQSPDRQQYQSFVPEGGKYTVGLDHAPAWFFQQPISIHGCIWYTDIVSNTEKSSEFFYLAFQNKDALPRSEGIGVFFARPFIYK
jgi:vacuolar-type H+-ATPase subunit H